MRSENDVAGALIAKVIGDRVSVFCGKAPEKIYKINFIYFPFLLTKGECRSIIIRRGK